MTAELNALIERAKKTEYGFTDIQRAAEEYAADHTVDECLATAHALYESEVPQAHMLATFIFGLVAARSPEAFAFLKERVSGDPNWRVQEILAKAFDQYCLDTGYERAMPTIEEWLGDERPNVRRAVTEGLRIWNARPYFREHPEVAVGLIAPLHADESEYVRKSVGNSLRDISKTRPDLVATEVARWDRTDRHVMQTYKLASRLLAPAKVTGPLDPGSIPEQEEK